MRVYIEYASYVWSSGSGDKDPLHLEISQFVYFMVQILFHKSNDI